jgi:CheY-like chemotaxis protein
LSRVSPAPSDAELGSAAKKIAAQGKLGGTLGIQRNIAQRQMANRNRLEFGLLAGQAAQRQYRRARCRIMMETDRQLNPESASPQSTSAVLLIDDNAIQAATRQAILRRAGYYVIASLNPTRALDQLQRDEFPAPIGAIITDHVMPGMDGAEFVRELRKTHPELPVMVLSGLDDAELEYAGLNVRFLRKPLSPELMLSNLHQLLHLVHEDVA